MNVTDYIMYRPHIEIRLETVQSYAADHRFMGTALVARDGQVLFSKGYGSANLEWDIPNSPNTKFRLGSVTKQFTAASILLLEERGKLSVKDPVKKYLPDAPAAWDKITIFHVLTHTSGIPNLTGFPDYAKLRPFAATAEQLVPYAQAHGLDGLLLWEKKDPHHTYFCVTPYPTLEQFHRALEQTNAFDTPRVSGPWHWYPLRSQNSGASDRAEGGRCRSHLAGHRGLRRKR